MNISRAFSSRKACGKSFWNHSAGLAEVFGFVLVSWKRFLAKVSCLGGSFCNHVLVSAAFGCQKPS